MNLAKKSRVGKTLLNEFKAMHLSDAALFLITLLIWTDRILLTYVRAFLIRLPIVGGTTDFLISALYVVLALLALPKIFKSIRSIDILAGLGVVLVCLLQFIVFPDNMSVLQENLPSFLLYTFPLYYVALSLDFDKIYPWLYVLSAVTIITFTVYKIFINEPMSDVQSIYQGDMWSAYNLLPHVGVVVIAMLQKLNVHNAVLSVLGTVMIALLGSRGPLLCIVAAVVLYLVFFKKYKYPFLARIFLIAVAVIGLVCLDWVMLFLYDLSESAGLSVRIFERYFDGTLSLSGGRDLIRAQLFERILKNPALGYGLYGDRAAIGTYAHNFLVELWHSFGVIIGTIVIGGAVVLFGRAAWVAKKVEKYALLFLPLFVSGFLKLFLSGSFLDEIYLFWLIGLSVNSIRSYNSHRDHAGGCLHEDRRNKHADHGKHGKDHVSNC